MKDKKIGEILIELGFCTSEDILKALDVQKQYHTKIGVILLNMGVITEQQLLRALSVQFEYDFIDDLEGISFFDISVPLNILIDNKIVPFREDVNYIYVLTNNPLNTEIFNYLEALKGKEVRLFLTVEENLRLLFPDAELEEKEDREQLILDEEIDKLKELASEAPVIKLVNSILYRAIEQGASDIHFESFKNGMKVRFRVDGVLYTVDNISNSLKLPVITRLKLISGMNISERRLPQDGRISLKFAGKDLDIRASSVPTQHGESFVLRLLKRDNVELSFEKLGFYPDHIEVIKKIYSKPNGIFLTTGPTGSGKTTTLYTIINDLNTDAVKIITVEDPVEYEFSGINQINVKPEIDFMFANALRNILRQDPDIVMIGEIRDKETAEIAIQASLTGHLVLSTLHTNSALASVPRLIDMGVEFYLIKASLVAVMAQRLVRTLCPYCSIVDEDFSIKSLKKYNIDRLIKNYSFVRPNLKKAVGCEKCNFTGYKGRSVIAEVVPLDSGVFKKFEENRSFNNISELGYRSMLEDGLLKVIEGKTTLEEVLRVVN